MMMDGFKGEIAKTDVVVSNNEIRTKLSNKTQHQEDDHDIHHYDDHDVGVWLFILCISRFHFLDLITFNWIGLDWIGLAKEGLLFVYDEASIDNDSESVNEEMGFVIFFSNRRGPIRQLLYSTCQTTLLHTRVVTATMVPFLHE
jgi:hypothetical protein